MHIEDGEKVKSAPYMILINSERHAYFHCVRGLEVRVLTFPVKAKNSIAFVV